MKTIVFVFALTLSSCSLFGSDKEDAFDLNGEWSDILTAPTLIGECCSFSLTLFDDHGRVTANGEIKTPGEYIGRVYINPVTGSGTWDGHNLSLSLRSGNRQAILTGHLIDGEWYDMEADFAGLGYTLNSFGMFKIDPDLR